MQFLDKMMCGIPVVYGQICCRVKLTKNVVYFVKFKYCM